MSQPRDSFDFVIVGGGPAGCVLAARLSEDPQVRVLLLEAGGEGRNFFIRMPAGNGFIFGRPGFDWRFQSIPQKELGGRRVYYPRGKALGGSSIMNGMILTRGNRRDYDAWADSGLPDWSYAQLLSYFKKSESFFDGPSLYRGGDGPLQISPAVNYGPLDQAFVEAGLAAGIPANSELNGAHQEGIGRIEAMVAGGERCNANFAYLDPARQRANLIVETDARAEQLIIEKGRVTGLHYRHQSARRTLHCGRVILAAGAFANPQLLELSGIGAAEHLQKLGISPLCDLPGVGENLQDHPNAPLQYRCLSERDSFARYMKPHMAISLGLQYMLARSGPGSGPFWGACAFAGGAHPRFQVFFTPMILTEESAREKSRWSRFNPAAWARAVLVRGQIALPGFELDVNLMRPEVRGNVHATSPDIADPPAINPRYLESENDQKAIVEAVKLGREIAYQKALDPFRGEEVTPGPAIKSDSEILDIMRRTVTTGHHPIGTCKMGPSSDPLAVVDENLSLHGLEGLSVCDASIFPNQITGNPNGPIIAIAEMAVDRILGRPLLPPVEL